jgi:KDO2-lipid IV(A) lauroyltransferase
MAARWLPVRLQHRLARILAVAWWVVAAERRRVVARNLLPICGDEAQARRVCRQVFQQFAVKLADLWRFENGQDMEGIFAELTGWEHVEAARNLGRGLLLVTPHLGNWELGGLLFARMGMKIKVVTMAEPGGLTELRQGARARRGIETIVIGDGGFGFVELIRHLEEGGVAALLLDRPPKESAVEIRFLGRPFLASIAPAELARASGCALVPVTIFCGDNGHHAQALSMVPYDRAALRCREARQALTQQLMAAFEPAIRQHPDQWFHFTSIWPESPS